MIKNNNVNTIERNNDNSLISFTSRKMDLIKELLFPIKAYIDVVKKDVIEMFSPFFVIYNPILQFWLYLEQFNRQTYSGGFYG